MKSKRLLMLSLLIFLATGTAIAATTIPDFGREESYYKGCCRIGGVPGNEFEFLVGDAIMTQCCPRGQFPTGRTDLTQQRCALPGAARGCGVASNTSVSYCMDGVPFNVCCPAGQIALCEPDMNRQQCVQTSVFLPPGEE